MYVALSGNLDDIVRRDQLPHFLEHRGLWFPRLCCDNHRRLFVERRLRGDSWEPESCCRKVAAFDRRTPGLFKVEYQGTGMVALNSKTYCCWSDSTGEVKISSKGLSKRTNNLTADMYKAVLRTKRKHSGTNKGFVYSKNNMFTYSQMRAGLTYFYAKRRVCSDGVSTTNIKI